MAKETVLEKVAENKKNAPAVFMTEGIKKSKKFSHIQIDMLTAILTKPFYTEQEAKDAINEAMGVDMFKPKESKGSEK